MKARGRGGAPLFRVTVTDYCRYKFIVRVLRFFLIPWFMTFSTSVYWNRRFEEACLHLQGNPRRVNYAGDENCAPLDYSATRSGYPP